MFVKKRNNGDYYLCCKKGNIQQGAVKLGLIKDIFTIKAKETSGILPVNVKSGIIFPQELIGKKIRLKVEIIKEYPERTYEGIYCECGKPIFDDDIKCSRCRKWEKIEKKRKKSRKFKWIN